MVEEQPIENCPGWCEELQERTREASKRALVVCREKQVATPFAAACIRIEPIGFCPFSHCSLFFLTHSVVCDAPTAANNASHRLAQYESRLAANRVQTSSLEFEKPHVRY